MNGEDGLGGRFPPIVSRYRMQDVLARSDDHPPRCDCENAREKRLTTRSDSEIINRRRNIRSSYGTISPHPALNASTRSGIPEQISQLRQSLSWTLAGLRFQPAALPPHAE